MGSIPDDENTQNNRSDSNYILPRSDYTLTPPTRSDNPAADVIRDKLAKLYAEEPDAFKEERQAEAVPQRSKHQQYMHELNNSGKNLAQVQTAWHEYYVALPDAEKHQVWKEFYDSSETDASTASSSKDHLNPAEQMAVVRNEMPNHTAKSKQKRSDRREASTIQKDIKDHATKRKLGKKQHLQSLGFGLGVGALVVSIFMFSFFNEVILAPLIQPARTSAATPLIVNASTVAPSSEPQVIIPKINVQIPIQFGITSTTEATMQKELESGVAHYPTTSNPGENGNGAYFGHSSNNLFNKGEYKFAFVLLNQLVPGDIFYITKDGKLYAYKVFDTKIVKPNQTEVLDPVEGHTATATLITCDPPGTSLNRLVVVGDQVSPEPSTNAVATTKTVDSSNSGLVGNGQTLWGRVIGSAAGKAVVGIVLVGAVLILVRTGNKKRPTSR